jgi:hypothetical protein
VSTANLMRRRVGVAILVAVMVVASLFGLLVGLLFPEGEDGHLTYASVAPDRTFIRTWLLLAALNLIVGLTAFALAGWLLVPARGWIAATVGACLIWVGCAVYALGIAGIATLYYFATDPGGIDANASERLVAHLDDSFLSVWGIAVTGAIVSTVGQVALAVGLWRARTVPRWIPILAATLVITFFLPTAGAAGLISELPSAISGLGLAWYFWRLNGGDELPSPTASPT